MKIIYFDCFAGVSGDMILGACVDAGVPISYLQKELLKLSLDGFDISEQKITKHSIGGTHVEVATKEQHHHRTLPIIEEIIQNSTLSEYVKINATNVFHNLAQAEAKIHKTTKDKIHFHEVGALDAIVDIVGAMICFEYLQVEKIYASQIHVGSGFIKCAHGMMPLPAPATAELLKEIPIYNTGIQNELTTPTGAAILKTMAESFGTMPQLTIESIGYGCGTRDLEIPNMLRLLVGNSTEKDSTLYDRDEIVQIETNIDDMNPQLFEHLSNKLFELGILDITLTQTIMKKQRPAVIVSILVEKSLQEKVIEKIFSETTTIGLRIQTIKRVKLKRELKKVTTPYGEISVKYSLIDGKAVQVKPEYDECKKAAEACNVPLSDIIESAKSHASDD